MIVEEVVIFVVIIFVRRENIFKERFDMRETDAFLTVNYDKHLFVRTCSGT